MPATLTFKNLYPIMLVDIRAGVTPALLGSPGIGKSSIVNDLAKELNTKVFALQINTLADRADLTGVRSVQDEVTKEWKQVMFPHATIADAIAHAKANPNETPILFLDEFNRASSDITSAILSLQTERRIGHHHLPKNLVIIVAGNDKGNVTSVDQASTSRFSIYHVMPDIETYFAVNPNLNPFIRDTLSLYPQELMSKDAVMTQNVVGAVANGQGDPDDDGDQDADLKMFAFDDEEAFKQITCPRTLTYLSDWMNAAGIDKSGSDEERDLLKMLLNTTTQDGSNTLLAMIQAKVGETVFAHHLFTRLHEYINTMATQGVSASQGVLDNLRPSHDFINDLKRATDVQAVETLLQSYASNHGDAAVGSAAVWLLEHKNVQEINNPNGVEHAITLGVKMVNNLSHVQADLFKLFGQPTKANKQMLSAFANSGAPSVNAYAAVINNM